jgi:tRNA N6-adenosine threonylcarbamoyltransferase
MRLFLSTETDHDSEAEHTVIATGTTITPTPTTGPTRKEERYQRARDKRRKFIGMAKAVDRGQWSVTYNPAVPSFDAKSGLPDRTRLFTVLGIESSCDDTGAAVVRSDGTILGEALASQHDIHEAWGGVVPGLARDAHVDKIDSVVEEALANANLSLDEIDAIGVTVGPGLEICLRVGCYKARELAVLHKKPFVGVHHLEAHILMARIGAGVNIPATPETHASERAMEFPFLALLVSGGHCQLMKCHGIGEYTIIGGTMDDSLGECRDKNVRTLLYP